VPLGCNGMGVWRHPPAMETLGELIWNGGSVGAENHHVTYCSSICQFANHQVGFCGELSFI
jgi:hypothetical protein